MHKGCILGLAAIAVIGGFVVPVAPTVSPAPAADAPGSDFARDAVGFVQKHCVHCHGDKMQKADLALHTYKDESSVLKGRKVWQNVLQMVKAGEMPPKGRPKPAAGESEAFVRAVNGLFERVDSGKRDPGRITIRRLNRPEYNNTIRDLMGVDFSPAADFPSPDKLPARAALPDPLVMLDGTRVKTAEQWRTKRRPELLALFQHYMYGTLPPAPVKVSAKTEYENRKALNGKAILREIDIHGG